MRGPVIPVYPYQSTQGIRLLYKDTFNREWPHDDAYLRELLAKGVPESNYLKEETRSQHLLLRMRENDA